MDTVWAQFPAGTYEVELSRRLADGTPAGIVGTTQFTVPQRSDSDPLWNHSDLWWNSAESGWGVNIMHHGTGPLFATWFVYGADGKATWYVVPGGRWTAYGEFRGSIYKTTGPPFTLCAPRTPCNPSFDPA